MRRIFISDATKQLIEASAGLSGSGGGWGDERWTGQAWALDVDEETYQRLKDLHPTDIDEAIRRAATKQFGHA